VFQGREARPESLDQALTRLVKLVDKSATTLLVTRLRTDLERPVPAVCPCH
jgi:hypothetical protein